MTVVGSSSTTDPGKLDYLVRKHLSSSNTENKSPNADQIVDWLRHQHREYQRKDASKLLASVKKVLKNIVIKEGDPEEDDYDKEARAHDQRSKSANSLNNSLTQRYRKLQNKNQESIESKDENGGLPMKRTRDDLRNTRDVGGGKLRKKSSSKRHSSSTNTHPSRPRKDDGTNICEAIPRPTERYTDLGGMEEILVQIRQLVEYPLVRPELYRHLGVDPPRDVLLRGPPG